MNIKIVFGVIITIVIFLFGAYFLVSNGDNKPKVLIASYSTTDIEKPTVEVKKTFIDLGTIKVSDQKDTEFTIKNVGTKPLQVSNMSSSCHCTFGQFIYQGKTSDEYGMSTVSDVFPEIVPNTEATIKVIYRPYIMPVYGPVQREVYLSTNDPNNPKIVFQVKTVVQ